MSMSKFIDDDKLHCIMITRIYDTRVCDVINSWIYDYEVYSMLSYDRLIYIVRH